MGAGAADSFSSDAYSWDAIVEELRVPQLPSAQLPAKGFALDWPDAVQVRVPRCFDTLTLADTLFRDHLQDSNESDAAFSNQQHTSSPLPLWGSVLLTKDKDAVQRLIQQQTQVAGVGAVVAQKTRMSRRLASS